MASHRDSASEQLKRTMENWKKPLDERQSLIALDRKYGLLPEPAIIDWNDPARRAAGAVQALLLTSGDSDELLRKAFDAFGLDPANPFNWRALLWAFAHAHFAPPRKKGAPKQWDDGKWCRLLSNFGEVKASSRARCFGYGSLQHHEETVQKGVFDPHFGHVASQFAVCAGPPAQWCGRGFAGKIREAYSGCVHS